METFPSPCFGRMSFEKCHLKLMLDRGEDYSGDINFEFLYSSLYDAMNVR